MRPRTENLRVLSLGSSTEGESGPKIRSKGVVNGQHVNIPVLPFVGPMDGGFFQSKTRIKGYRPNGAALVHLVDRSPIL